MRKITLKQLEDSTKLKVLSKFATEFTGVGTDTRSNLKGQLFLALHGENFDAHEMLDKAIQAGAAGILIHRLPEKFQVLKHVITVLEVGDTLRALQDLGNWFRHQSKAKVIAITGSNGKTTTKEFTAAIVGSVKKIHFNKGSFNNHWGVPFNLMQLPVDTDVAIVEMGMNHANEISRLVEIADPDIVCCTMVGRAHIEHFPDGILGIAKAKQEIYQGRSEKVVQVYNLDDENTLSMYQQAVKLAKAKKIFTFSEKKTEADVCLQIESMGLRTLQLSGTIAGVSGKVEVAVFGKQNLTNLMAAATLSLAAGLTAEQIWKGLAFCKTNWGRNQLVKLQSEANMIFDAYNANPDSMKALLENVMSLSIEGKKIGIFGEMLEMGPQSEQLHQELGQLVGACKFSEVYFLGSKTEAFEKGLKKAKFKGQSVLMKEFDFTKVESLKTRLAKGDLVVVKGSRGMKLEQFLPACEPVDFSSKT